MTADDRIKLVECPRDAWQGLPAHIPVEAKAEYLRLVAAAGFPAIDAASFVSSAAVPQMADSERVLELLGPVEGVDLIGIVVNARGAERAVATGAVTTLGFPYSISAQFLRRNQNQSPEESLEVLDQIGSAAYRAGLDVVVYVSMGFGNPYGEPWSVEEVLAACDLLTDNGIAQVSLADTAGVASPEAVGAVVAAVRREFPQLELGVHLHSRPADTAAKVRAAYLAGGRRFDSAIGGLGGCPFAQDALVGNLATEKVVETLAGLGAKLPELAPLDSLLAATREIESRYGHALQ